MELSYELESSVLLTVARKWRFFYLLCVAPPLRYGTQLWAEMLEEGIAVDGEVLAPYVKAIMLGGDCEQAIGVRKRYRKADDESKIRKDLGFLETPVGGKVGRTRAVLDSIVCEGLVNNGKAEEAIEELFYALQMIPTVRVRYLGGGGGETIIGQ